MWDDFRPFYHPPILPEGVGHPQGYGFAEFKGARLSLSWLPKLNAPFNLNLNYPPRSGFSSSIKVAAVSPKCKLP